MPLLMETSSTFYQSLPADLKTQWDTLISDYTLLKTIRLSDFISLLQQTILRSWEDTEKTQSLWYYLTWVIFFNPTIKTMIPLDQWTREELWRLFSELELDEWATGMWYAKTKQHILHILSALEHNTPLPQKIFRPSHSE